MIRNYLYSSLHIAIILVTTIYTLKYYYIAPIWDYSHVINYLYQDFQGNLKWYNAHFIMGGHWYLVSTNWQIFLAQFTNWDLLYEAISIIVTLIAVWFLWLKRTISLPTNLDKTHLHILLLLGTLFSFSLSQSNNFLWTTQLSHYFHNFGVMLCALCVSQKDFKLKHFLGCVIGAALAIYSYSSGFALLIAVPIAIYFRKDASYRPILMVIWGIFSALCIMNFIYAFNKYVAASTLGNIDFDLSFTYVFNNIWYVIKNIGAPIAKFAGIVVPIIGIIVILATLLLTRSYLKDNKVSHDLIFVWFLILFAIGGMIISSVGRYGFGIAQAVNPRNFTVPTIFWLGFISLVILTMPSNFRASKLKYRLGLVLVAVVVMLQTFNSVHYGLKHIKHSKIYNQAAYEVRENWPNTSDQTMIIIFHDAKNGNELMKKLKEMKLNIFSVN